MRDKYRLGGEETAGCAQVSDRGSPAWSAPKVNGSRVGKGTD
jgi:hypothetical protein